MRTFWKRLTSSVILLALLAFILVGPKDYSRYVFDAIAVIFAYFAVWEFGTILQKSGHTFFLRSAAFYTAATVLVIALVPDHAALVCLLPMAFIIHCWTQFLTSKNQDFVMRGIFASTAAYFLFAIPFCCVISVFYLDQTQYHILFLFLLLVTKIGDIAAYVIGSLAGYFLRNHGGNHKMIPSISPGKSYEGAAGGLIFTVILSYVLWPYCGVTSILGDFWTPLIVGIFMCFGCMGGDLSESAFKRTCKIKDSGSILPGIGGILDLVDSLMVTGPLFLLFLIACTNLF